MTSNHEASTGSVASDDEIAALVNGKDGLRVLLQPQVDLLTGRIVSAEALARWHHPRLGIVMPGEFIPAINRLGLDRAFFERVSLRAIDMLLTLRRAGIAVPLAVNAPASTLSDERAVDFLLGRIHAAELPASLLRVELTEDQPIRELDVLRAALLKLENAGCEVSLDDFGTGHASLKLLSAIPLSEVKIDQYFVTRMRRSAVAFEVLRAAAELANRLGRRVVAEGVENVADIPALRAAGCRYGQGFALGRPMPLDELMMRLRTQRERGEALAAPIPYASTWLDAYDDARQDAPPARRTRHVTTQ
ncbi:response regulator [Achromobacter sp. HZ01]|jgi:EAL domain-containing protein (putative c-di-GMP-specific phosphodiesterase class I)|uniref:EAL domain-containing protein n=1 Tax=Achromobacter pulmonis TaxID=1389932 RepID=A0A2N8KP85_9BURK|nr:MULTISPECIES: EAL domain-containing protein [Achromobacter]MBO9329332.1 EAL domain-containing protein [Achromobacter xylosoxidans]PND35266.1 EAL domain-containing protein [Achromobacter pulmonis]RAP65359.1 response regulator [Achromobacter sp. HZ01]